jgi:hypothetical protein
MAQRRLLPPMLYALRPMLLILCELGVSAVK